MAYVAAIGVVFFPKGYWRIDAIILHRTTMSRTSETQVNVCLVEKNHSETAHPYFHKDDAAPRGKNTSL